VVELDNILIENEKRNALLHAPYDPLTGIGSPIERFPFAVDENTVIYLPKSMEGIEEIQNVIKAGSVKKYLELFDELRKNIDENTKIFMAALSEIRMDHDFEYWAAVCIKIQDKETLEEIPFVCRGAQRKLLKDYEEQRLANQPIREVVDKARQWGGSTLTQIYMMWIQQRLKTNWHSAICAHLDDAARNIRGMYTRAAQLYPADLGTITLAPYEKSGKNVICKERGCIIGVGSVENPDQFRSYNYAMIHLSEVAMYSQTTKKNANKLVQSLRSTVPNVSMSMVVLESTAMGRGNLFHREWMAAIEGRSAYRACFVSWWEIDLYWKKLDNLEEFYLNVVKDNEYYRWLWELGATLEGINWYISFKAGENYSDLQMNQEFPSTAEESFTVSGRRVFNPYYTQRASKTCTEPVSKGQLYADAIKGKDAFKNIVFRPRVGGELWIWEEPDTTLKVKNRYVVICDIGGKSKGADYSTIRVFDRYWMSDGGVPEAVATWRGHLDQDLFAWLAAQVAYWYGEALLIIESNSLRSSQEDTEGEHYLTILDEISGVYQNLYTRTRPEQVRQGVPTQYGFHTNKQTKPMVIDALNAAFRDGMYIEKDIRVIDEADQFEHKPDGTMGAVEGAHDDLVMPTAIGVWAMYSAMDPCVEVKERERATRKVKRTEASL